jgi:hypothetical protein
MKLDKVIPSKTEGYKYDAVFIDDDEKEKIVHFGASGYKDYIIYNKEEGKSFANQRKELYILRHKMKEDWNDPTSRGALSRWILWNLPTLEASISDYKKKFNL